MTDDTSERILQDIRAELVNTPYAFDSARILSGGTANFIFEADLSKSLPDGTAKVAIKHGEDFIRQSPSFPLPTSRCRVEESCIKYLSAMTPHVSPRLSVGTPKLFYFDEESNTQVQEYQPSPLSLKLYALEYFASSSSESVMTQCLDIGEGIGQWLRKFHDWSNSPEQFSLRDIAAANKEMQSLKQWANYQRLPDAIRRHPSTLGDCAEVFTAVVGHSAKELEDEQNLQVIHGDFWTGNILLEGRPWESDHIRLFVVDWEMFQLALTPLDLGQMIAELYELKLYKDMDAGLWLIQGLMKGYGAVDDGLAFRTLLHVGVHLLGFGTTVQDWGTPEQVENVAATGRDIVLNSWSRHRAFFEDHPLGCIF